MVLSTYWTCPFCWSEFVLHVEYASAFYLPWYNHTNWLGVKHQLTYYTFYPYCIWSRYKLYSARLTGYQTNLSLGHHRQTPIPTSKTSCPNLAKNFIFHPCSNQPVWRYRCWQSLCHCQSSEPYVAVLLWPVIHNQLNAFCKTTHL